jgi:serine/threonine protein phosphatase PrpC
MAVAIHSTLEMVQGKRASFKEKDEEVMLPPSGEFEEQLLRSWLAHLGIGWACKKGLKPTSPNQDSFSVLMVEDTFLLAGVYDGHGPKGHFVSAFARRAVQQSFLANPKRSTDPEGACVEAFLEAQKCLQANKQHGGFDSGSTATMLYFDYETARLTIAHVGDARIAMGKRKDGQSAWECEDLTVDHKPNDPKEKERIESAKPPGRVLWDGHVNYRVYVQEAMYPGLAMSRALGDVLAHKRCGVTAKPDTKSFNVKDILSEYPEAVVLICSDGVWEFLDADKSFGIINSKLPSEPACAMNDLAERAWQKWMQDSDDGISDDITAVCINLGLLMSSTRGTLRASRTSSNA